jgi:hypothetical protein
MELGVAAQDYKKIVAITDRQAINGLSVGSQMISS